jgi:1,4-alpha-glucan branching enzyme
MINKMPGEGSVKFANLRLAYTFFMTHPGKKLLFMGQDFAQLREWSEERELDWYLLAEEPHQQIHDYMKELLHMYKKYPALHELDHQWDGFEWINADDRERSIFSYIRKSSDGKKCMVCVLNFTPVAREDYRVGVPAPGSYKLLLNSDDPKYGGSAAVTKKSYRAQKGECDGQPYSIAYPLPGFGAAIFSFDYK